MVKKQSKKRVPGYRKVEVRDPVFFGHLIVLVGPWGKCAGYLSRKFPGLDPGTPGDRHAGESFEVTTTEPDGSTYDTNIVWMERWDGGAVVISMLAHELIHFCVKHFAKINIPVLPDNNEAFAYYYGKVFTEVFTKLSSAPPKRRKG